MKDFTDNKKKKKKKKKNMAGRTSVWFNDKKLKPPADLADQFPIVTKPEFADVLLFLVTSTDSRMLVGKPHETGIPKGATEGKVA